MLEIDYGVHRILFTGDIENKAEEHLHGKVGDIDVLKVSHHGSKSSSSIDWIKELRPEYSVISCAKNNPFGHPHPDTLWNLKSSRVYRTDIDGTVVFVSDGRSIEKQ